MEQDFIAKTRTLYQDALVELEMSMPGTEEEKAAKQRVELLSGILNNFNKTEDDKQNKLAEREQSKKQNMWKLIVEGAVGLLGLGVTVGTCVYSAHHQDALIQKALEFEETGHVTATVSKGLFSGITRIFHKG